MTADEIRARMKDLQGYARGCGKSNMAFTEYFELSLRLAEMEDK